MHQTYVQMQLFMPYVPLHLMPSKGPRQRVLNCIHNMASTFCSRKESVIERLASRHIAMTMRYVGSLFVCCALFQARIFPETPAQLRIRILLRRKSDTR